MVRYYVIFSGIVQGVGFRYSLVRLALARGLTGWVRNRYDGKVEAEIQGDYFKVMEVINKIGESSSYISVDDYSIKEIELVKNEKSFNAIY